MNFVRLWEWAHQYRDRNRDDPMKLRLATLYSEAWSIIEANPKKSLRMYQEGSQLAQTLHEPCWYLFYENRRCATLLFYLGDYKQAMSLAVKNVLLLQEAKYEYCPIRARVYRCLIDAYQLVDPVGYADEIEENLDYLENNIPLDIDTWRLVPRRRATQARAVDDWELCLVHAKEHQVRSGNDHYRLLGVHGLFCRIYFELKQYDLFDEHLVHLDRMARINNRKLGMSCVEAWRALQLLRNGDEAGAESAVDRAVNLAQAVEEPPYYHFQFCEYYKQLGQYDRAVEVLYDQLAIVQKSGGMHDTAETWYSICATLKEAGQPFSDEMKQAEEFMTQLRKPEFMRNKLSAL